MNLLRAAQTRVAGVEVETNLLPALIWITMAAFLFVFFPEN